MPEEFHGVDVVHPGALELAEGPVWDERTRRLWFVDILRGGVHRIAPDTGAHEEWHCDRLVGALALTEHPDVIAVATDQGFAIWDLTTPTPVTIARVDHDDPDIRMNDGKVAPDGTFWAGTMSMRGDRDRGRLHRLNDDHSTSVLVDGLTLSNGLGWSPDGKRLYLIDSVRDTILDVALGDDLSPGAVSTLIDTSSLSGLPDGMTVDAEGFLWVCFWGGAAIRRFDPSGELTSEHLLPVDNPTSCAFGGPDLDRLFVTTARYGLTDAQLDEQPLAGAVLSLTPGVTGMPTHRCTVPIRHGAAERRGPDPAATMP